MTDVADATTQAAADEAATVPAPALEATTPAPETPILEATTFWVNLGIVVTSERLTRAESLVQPVYQRLRQGLGVVRREYPDLYVDGFYVVDHEGSTAALKALSTQKTWNRHSMDGFTGDLIGGLLEFLNETMPTLIESIYDEFNDSNSEEGDNDAPGILLCVLPRQLDGLLTDKIGTIQDGDVFVCGLSVTATEPTPLPERMVGEGDDAEEDDVDEPHWATRSTFTCELVQVRRLQDDKEWDARSQSEAMAVAGGSETTTE